MVKRNFELPEQPKVVLSFRIDSKLRDHQVASEVRKELQTLLTSLFSSITDSSTKARVELVESTATSSVYKDSSRYQITYELILPISPSGSSGEK